jgi:hypothetical protein
LLTDSLSSIDLYLSLMYSSCSNLLIGTCTAHANVTSTELANFLATGQPMRATYLLHASDAGHRGSLLSEGLGMAMSSTLLDLKA